MENDELELETTPNPDLQEKKQELEEIELEDPKSEDLDSQGSDPLDNIQDTSILLAEAKKYRAIARRHKAEKPKPEAKIEVKPETGDYLKKSDFELANQKKAIRTATIVSENDTEEAKTLKTDLLENWDKVRQFYTPRRGKDTPEDVYEDIKDAYAVFNTRRPKKEVKPDIKELSETKITPTGNAPEPKSPQKQPPRFNLPKTTKEWYS